jgi:hypothetical protein
MLGGSFGNLPGMTDTSPYLTYENAFGWGGFPRQAFVLSQQIDSTTADAGASPTWRLRPGLVLGRINSSGNLKQYDPTATDGSNIAVAVLVEGMRMQDVFSGSNVAKFLGVMVSGPVRGSALYGLDQKARFDMALAGFLFDDDVRGPQPWRRMEIAGNQTVTIASPALGSNYQNATEFIVTSGGGAAIFNLPTIAPGLKYKFYNANNQSLTIQGGTNSIVAFNNTAVTNVAVSTANAKIGACLEFEATYMGSATYQWVLRNMSAGANTLTLS